MGDPFCNGKRSIISELLSLTEPDIVTGSCSGLESLRGGSLAHGASKYPAELPSVLKGPSGGTSGLSETDELRYSWS